MAKLPRLSKNKEVDPLAPVRGKVLTPRFAIALALMLAGIGWIIYYYFGMRPDAGWPEFEGNKGSGPTFFQDIEDYNYLIGFIALFLGLTLSAHPDTPLGRGRGVVVGMLGCFIIGLIWICLFYIFLTGDDPRDMWVLGDLGQKNLFVGIAFMAVGFTFATKWE